MRYVSVVARNLIPLAGALFFGWSAFMLLELFWCDGVLNAIFGVIRIVAYRHLSEEDFDKPHRFEWVGPARTPAAMLRQYVRRAIPLLFFCQFLLFAVFEYFQERRLPVHFEQGQFAIGVTAAALIGAVELLIELPSLRRRSFAWLQWRVWSTDPSLLAFTLVPGFLLAIWFETATAALIVLVFINVIVDFAAMAVKDAQARLWPAGWDG